MKPFLVAAAGNDLIQWSSKYGLPSFRVRQIEEWIFRRFILEPEKMNNLPGMVRENLKQDFYAPGSQIAETVVSDDGTEKLRIELFDGESIEMVIIPAGERITFCLSTQVGCPVRCRFCASGSDGLVRNLYAGEMVEEFLFGCSRIGRKPDNIVFMGIGEGLLNFSALAQVLKRLTDKDEFGLSPRRITVSTSGYVPGIKEFAALNREYQLAVSLHAPDDETRAKIIPPPLRFPIEDILQAADDYYQHSGRQYTLEYTLLAGVNDSIEQAKQLGLLARRHHAKVNVIAYNPAGNGFHRPESRVIENFVEAVTETGARVTRRMERGSKHSAACGQLRKRSQKG